MKKIQILVLLAMAMFSSCLDYSLDAPSGEVTNTTGYILKVNSSTVATNDTIYGATTNEILFFATTLTDSLVAIQLDFGDGSIDAGTQVLHQYKVAGIYQLKVTIVGKNVILNRTVKITAPSVTSSETIVQLSGNTIGDSVSINLLCRKDKIYNNELKGKYFLKGDMTSWKTAITAVDTNFVYKGIVYLQFNFKVKNNEWCSFGYYKATYDLGEHWSYDPLDQFWDVTKGLYKFYVSNGKIYKNQLTAATPGACGDISNSTIGACIRLDYETNGSASDSLIIYANRGYFAGSDSTKFGISYTVDGGSTIVKKARFVKNTNFIFIKAPVTKSSTVRFKTYSDLANLIVGDMTSSAFYNTGTSDCYLVIAGTIQSVKGLSSGKSSGGLFITAADGTKFQIN